MSFTKVSTACERCDGYSHCFCRTCSGCGGHRTARNRTDKGTLCERCQQSKVAWIDLGPNGFAVELVDASLRAGYRQGWTFEMTTAAGDIKIVREYKIPVTSAKRQALWYLRGWLMETAPDSDALRFLNGAST